MDMNKTIVFIFNAKVLEREDQGNGRIGRIRYKQE